ncbi:MAG: RNA polymerase sporulation sigma factor SigH [Selenomonadaceae bacterium]|nr:RNA polymerase sporulation sigma factor SigH [Selenomonadaceae bacterium]
MPSGSEFDERKTEPDTEAEDDFVWTGEDSRFANMSDEEIIIISQENNDSQAQDYIINKYRNFVRVKARSYFLIGADREDIIQEGMIGLFKAIRDYRREKLSSFHAFAELCVTRQIITAIKTATRQKHIPLNSYISINKPIYDEDSDRTLLDVLPGGKVSDPEEMVISQEEYSSIAAKMETILSELEWRVLISYLDGHSYQEIADDLHRHVKSIDNALQRVKRKLEKYMGSYMRDIDLTTIYHGITTINRELHDVDVHREKPTDGVRHHKIRKKKK